MSWRSLEDEIARWRDAGRTVEFSGRDDDADRADRARSSSSSKLSAQGAAAPLALAVDSTRREARALREACARCVLLHGTDHRNLAPPRARRKTEFSLPTRPGRLPLGAGSSAPASCLTRSSPDRAFLPVLAPPWNRFRRLAAAVRSLPYRACTGSFELRAARGCAIRRRGSTEVNTHIDIIDWRGTR